MPANKITGLTPQQVTQSREKHGDNVLTPPERESVWKLFIGKFNDPIIKILLVAATLSLIISFTDGHFAETIGIIVAILLATCVSFWFEYDAKRRFEVLNTVNDDTPVKVVREGSVTEIPKKDVVVGDVVVLASGDEVPADGKLLEAVSLRLNESTLTGEPIIDKTVDPAELSEEATYPSDQVLRGTTVMEGNGVAEITAVGDSTEYGKVAEQSSVESEEHTPLDNQLRRLSKLISRVGGGLAVLVFVILVLKGMFFGGDLLEADFITVVREILGYFMVSVAIMVMAIPEGLPMSITLSLAMSMRRMLKTNNLVRKMHACETMGAVTVICTDKTGTLTKNQMNVSEIKPFKEIDEDAFSEMIALNSTAYLDDQDKVIGNPTEGALLLWLRERGKDYNELRESTDILDQLTFTTERKFMATLVQGEGTNLLFVKGAPEIVLGMSEQTGLRPEVELLLADYQNKAMRTLGFAYRETESDDCEEAVKQGGLQFVAVAAITDPVREEVPDAVARCMDAGIQVKIVTGDTPATAREIARQIGLWNDATDGDENLITGVDFERASDEELLGRIGGIKIMSRARPLDKQRLVKLLQQKGEVVAVTGDGTNDAPALNFAQVGLSMGSGTSVAKEASDITLLDDSFGSIATAVMWGRSLYKNIQRFVMFQLTVNLSALAVVFLGSVFGNEMPLTVTQILWVNLIMDTFAALALASLPPNPNVMKEKPRRQTDFIIDRKMLRWILGVGTVIITVLLAMLFGWKELSAYQLSLFFTAFVMMQFWNLFNARVFGSNEYGATPLLRSPAFLWILLIILAGQFLITTFGGSVFRTVPLTATDWGIIIGSTSLIAIGGYLFRMLSRRRIPSI